MVLPIAHPDEFTVSSNLLLRTGFEIRCLSSSFAGNVANFENQANKLISSVNQHDYGLLGDFKTIPPLVGLRPESCSWSVYMVIDHLRRHTDFLLGAMRALVVDDELRAPMPTLRYFQPEDVGSESVDQFQDSVWQYVGFANNLKDSGQQRQTTGTIAHPIYGRLDVKRLSVYGAQHLSLHRRQVQKIIALIGVV